MSSKTKIYFPYDTVRNEQELLLKDVTTAITEGKILLAHAPTGLGKTAAVLAPAISYALENEKTVFFLTPKISQHEIAVELARLMKKKFKLPLNAVDLVGRKFFCIDPFVSSAENSSFYELCRRKRAKEQCEYFGRAVGYSDKERNMANKSLKVIQEHVSKKGVMSHVEMREYLSEFSSGLGVGLCPYEVSTRLGKNSQLIIADYYHVFNPGVAKIVMARLGKKPKDCIFVVDEAHNLPERLRQLSSLTMSKMGLKRAAKELELIGDAENRKILLDIKKTIGVIARKNKERIERLVSVDELRLEDFGISDVDEFSAILNEAGSVYMDSTGFSKSGLFPIARFIEHWNTQIPGQIRLVKGFSNNNANLMIKLLDPAPISSKILNKGHSSILMSGTFLPTEMYADLLGIDENRAMHSNYKSPFKQEKRLNLVVPNVTTKYTQRGEKEFDKIAQVLLDVIEVVPGNAAIFFPSFDILDTVLPRVQDRAGRKIFFQKRNMSGDERFELLKNFKNSGKGFGAVLFAVSAGMFAEGIDYIGDQLLASVVVGVPLQEMNLETKSLVEYYEDKFGKGWHYGYIFPAMSRAIQASGRVIRDENDYGVSIFLDKRYLWSNYAKCFPSELKLVSTDNPKEKIIEFFNNMS